MQKKFTRVVAIGGGHCNCQVLKMLKKELPDTAKLTLVTEAPKSYYSGMLPGAIAKLYKDEDIQVELEPLAKWCSADYVEKRVKHVNGAKKQIIFEDETALEYDILALNVGSRTRGARDLKGVWDHSITTRPINDMLGKIIKREKELQEQKIVPSVVVCGAGAAGIELSFAFKERWSKLFKKEINVQLICADGEILKNESLQVRNDTKRKLKEKNIEIHFNGKVQEVSAKGVQLIDGRFFACDVPIWATGAEPQQVTKFSDMEVLGGYARVNDHLQSTSHPNIFAGGDCITMESHFKNGRSFPPKAGVYAVREGPIIAQNIVNQILGKPLIKYVPQPGFLALLMTGDGKGIGTKFNISFTGKWVWGMKDFIDTGFMKLFNPHYLFKDYEKLGFAHPLENNELFEEEKTEERSMLEPIKQGANLLSAKAAADALGCHEEEAEFHERLFIIDRMGRDESFMKEVISHYKPKI